MPVTLLVAPTVMPVTLNATKAFMRVEHEYEDTLISDLISTATEHVETICKRKLITQTWRQYIDKLPYSRMVKLELSPVQSLKTVHVYDTDGNPSTINPDRLDVDLVSSQARVLFPEAIQTNKIMNGIELDIIAGYSSNPKDIPSPIRNAIMQLVATWYEIRGTTTWKNAVVPVPKAVHELLSPYKYINL